MENVSVHVLKLVGTWPWIWWVCRSKVLGGSLHARPGPELEYFLVEV